MDRIWKVYRLTHYFGPQGMPYAMRTHLFTVYGGTFGAARAQAIARCPSLAERDGRNLEVCGDLCTANGAA